jgi:hypothetical protein
MAEDGKIAKSISVGGALIAIAVSLNGLITSCTEQELANHKAFRDAVAAEELFWKGLYSDYLTIFASEMLDNERQRNAKIIAIHSLAQREIPQFEEFSSLGEEHDLTRDRLQNMKNVLLDSLEDERSSDEETSQSLKNASFQSAASQQSAAVSSGDIPVARTSQPERSDVIVYSGPSDGWDLDFYWCPTPENDPLERQNYNQALLAANAFANIASEGRNIIPGTKLGRLRVRPVSDRLNRLINTNVQLWVTWNEGPGEEEMATQVLNRVSSNISQDFRLMKSVGTPTPYYTSVFFCSQNTG